MDAARSNPLLEEWSAPYGLPPFERITADHFVPAFDVALAANRAEIDAIARHPEEPSFANTLEQFDASGRLLRRIRLLLLNLSRSETSPALQAVEREMAPRLAMHDSSIYQHAALFQRIEILYAARNRLALDAEQLRLLERVRLDFVRAGAKLSPRDRLRHGEVVKQLAELHARFSQNVLADESLFVLELKDESDLKGLPGSVRLAAQAAAQQRDRPPGSHLITLSPSLYESFMTFSARRDLRERVWRAWVARGAHSGSHDNRPLVTQILALRQEQAALHGYASFAEYQLADRMAGSPAAATDLLLSTWEQAKLKAEEDRDALRAMACSLGEPTPIAAWDWRYLAGKVREQRFGLDETELRAHFELDNMIKAMFDCAGRLFGLTFIEKHGVQLYQPDVRLWEVLDRNGRMIGIYMADNFARPTKRSGAWMSVLRSQSGIDGGTLPIVINNNNIAKAETTLLSEDELRTLFHEFGHGLHGLLSTVRYERLAGTQVLSDYVEFPSQLFENWAFEEIVLRTHARHYQTGEGMSVVMLERMQAARQFDQAWHTLQYVGPALIDMALHVLPAGATVDIESFEAKQCVRLGVPEDIGLRHHLAHFQHLFAGTGYAAGYYGYLWAEVLVADGYEAFLEAGDPFDRETATRLLQHIYSAGNREDPAGAYRAFRGRDPMVEPMLRKRGLIKLPHPLLA
jgi:peptidyl-dipeptidase Dcp